MGRAHDARSGVILRAQTTGRDRVVMPGERSRVSSLTMASRTEDYVRNAMKPALRRQFGPVMAENSGDGFVCHRHGRSLLAIHMIQREPPRRQRSGPLVPRRHICRSALNLSRSLRKQPLQQHDRVHHAPTEAPR
jgi:hypothetical protein